MILLAAYFIFILDSRNGFRQKASSSDFFLFLFFFLSSKWVIKQQRTLNISNVFGPGTANEHTVQWRFKKFCRGK